MSYFKINQDGTLQSRSKKVDGWLHLDKLIKDENDELYKYYNLTPNEDGNSE